MGEESIIYWDYEGIEDVRYTIRVYEGGKIVAWKENGLADTLRISSAQIESGEVEGLASKLKKAMHGLNEEYPLRKKNEDDEEGWGSETVFELNYQGKKQSVTYVNEAPNEELGELAEIFLNTILKGGWFRE